MELTQHTLSHRWAELRQDSPQLRIRNAAAILGCSEAELLATQVGNKVQRLRPEFASILSEIETLGKVMALTRNEEVVHERKGVYLNPSLENPHVGLFVGEDIDLRIFFQCWAHAFAVEEEAKGGLRRSLQFFASDGEAIHKIYLTPHSEVEAYEALVDKYRSDVQTPEVSVQPLPAPTPEKLDEDIAVAEFQQGWLTLRDTHDFFGLLKKFGVTRTQALRLAPPGGFAISVKPQALRTTIEIAALTQTPIMAFVGNKGMIQIHTGPVKRLLDHEGWFNVMDPDFNLHVKEAGISSCWIVRKPTEDGMVTALECFNEAGEQVLQLFGKRKPGIPELPAWKTLIESIESRYA